MITRAKISAVRANSFVVVEQFIVFFLVIRNFSNKRRVGGAALINFFVPDAALIRGRRLFELALRSDEGLTLETSAFQIFHGGHSTFINSFDKINFCFNLPPTQHHSFFRNSNFCFKYGIGFRATDP